MSDFERDPRGPGYQNGLPRAARSTNSWIAAAVVVIVVVLGIGYAFQDHRTGAGVVEHKASVTDAPAPATAPINPTPSAVPATPAATPKP